MTTKSQDTGFPNFFTDAKSAESVRRQFLEAPLEAARQSMLGPALELAQLLRLLPGAFADSQQRELKRVKASAEKNDPRIAALEESIEQADALRTMARRGEVRAQRSLVAYATRNEVFHGFVSDSELNPLEGLTVQLATGKARSGNEFSCITDDDGYFSIPIGTTKRAQWEKEGEKMSPEQVAELLADRGKERNVYQQQGAEMKGVRVEILKKDKVIYEDPVPMGLGEGTVYREYVISEKRYSSASDFQNFMSQSGGYTKEPKESASSGPKKSTDTPDTTTTSQSASKKPVQGAKSTKPTSKK